MGWRLPWLWETAKAAGRTQATGAQGEEIAARHLKRAGLVILERNVRVGGGELDLVARDGETLVFVEVKTCRSDRFGLPEEWVGPRKQAQLARLAAAYLNQRGITDRDCRFDVVGVYLQRSRGDQVVHLRNAFGG